MIGGTSPNIFTITLPVAEPPFQLVLSIKPLWNSQNERKKILVDQVLCVRFLFACGELELDEIKIIVAPNMIVAGIINHSIIKVD